MSSIIRRGDTFHGISVESRGVFTNKRGWTYAGQIRDGYACGLGVLTWPNGKVYAEHGPDGKFDGRWLERYLVRSATNYTDYTDYSRWANGNTNYSLFERGGKQKEFAYVYADGRCTYNSRLARRTIRACLR